MIWYRIAATLSVPVCELKCRITHSEFLGWIEYFNHEENRADKYSYYLAQIAAEIQRSVVTDEDRKKVKIENYLIRFGLPESVKDKMKRSKAAWGEVVGLDLSRN